MEQGISFDGFCLKIYSTADSRNIVFTLTKKRILIYKADGDFVIERVNEFNHSFKTIRK